MSEQWDVALTGMASARGEFKVTFPAGLSRALAERHYNRAVVTVTDEGIVLVPYVGETRRGRNAEPAVPLPDWKKGKK